MTGQRTVFRLTDKTENLGAWPTYNYPASTSNLLTKHSDREEKEKKHRQRSNDSEVMPTELRELKTPSTIEEEIW